MTRIVVATLSTIAVALGLTLTGEQPARQSAALSAPRTKISAPMVALPQSPTSPRTPAPQSASTRDLAVELTADEQTALVKQYCATCHSDRGKAGGLTLASFDAAKILDQPAVAEKMIRKLRGA